MAATTGQKILMGAGGLFIGQQLLNMVGQWLYSNVQFSVGTPTVDTSQFGLGILRVKLPISINNQNAMGVGIVSLKGTVTYGQVRVADINLPIGVAVPAHGAVPLNLDIDINVTNVLQDITSIIQSSGSPFAALVNTLRLKAMLQTDLFNLAIPIDTNIPIA